MFLQYVDISLHPSLPPDLNGTRSWAPLVSGFQWEAIKQDRKIRGRKESEVTVFILLALFW